MKAHPLLQSPCQEDYTQMPQAPEGGFHCGKCAHVVTDFRTMSDAEIIHYLRANASQKVCGLFQPKKYVLASEKRRPVTSRWDFLPKGAQRALQVFALALALSFSGWGGGASVLMAQIETTPTAANSGIAGRLDCSRPVEGKLIRLRQGNVIIKEFRLNSGGDFGFYGLTPGTYVLEVDGTPFDIPNLGEGIIAEMRFTLQGDVAVQVPTSVPEQIPLAGAPVAPEHQMRPTPVDSLVPTPTPGEPMAPSHLGGPMSLPPNE